MSEQAIKKLRRKFTWSAFLSFLIVMLVMGGMIYFVNLHTTIEHIHEVLNYIVENNGSLFDKSDDSETKDELIREQRDEDIDKFVKQLFHISIDTSPEFRYSTRYFSVGYDTEGNVKTVETQNIASVTTEQAKKYAAIALKSNNTYGSIGDYYYQRADKENGTMVVFMDCTANMGAVGRLMNIILTLVVVGAAAAYFLVKLMSLRMIQPEIRAAERQKQFITNAGHELKTPLAVIKANTELDVMLNGENDWNQSTLRQIDRMTELIANLITIARAEEVQDSKNLTDVSVSTAAGEVADSFQSVAVNAGKTLETEIEPDVYVRADEGKIRQLVTLLTDNAIKYCDEKGKIRMVVSSKGKNARLEVFNDYAAGEKLDCSRFFERFYRADTSHNADKGGYGIGLSIAESIVKGYSGTIRASYSKGVICFRCLFPRKIPSPVTEADEADTKA